MDNQEVLDYFGLSSDGLYFEDPSALTGLKRVGVLIHRRDDGSFDTIALNSINKKESETEDFMLYASKTKFMDRLRGKSVEDSNINWSMYL